MSRLSPQFLVAALALVVCQLSTGAELSIVGADEPPTNFTANGKPTGFVVEVVERLEQDLGIRVPMGIVPASRAIAYLSQAPNVIGLSIGKTPEREALGFYFLGPITTRDQIVWKHKGKAFKISGPDDIKRQNLLLGSPIGDWRTKHFMDEGISVDESGSHALDLIHLQHDMIDLCAMSDLEMPYVAREAGLDSSDFEPAYVFARATKGYIVFSKNTPAETIQRWERAFKNLQRTDFLDATAKKWSTPGNPLSYSASLGFYRRKGMEGR